MRKRFRFEGREALPCTCCNNLGTMDRIAHLLTGVLAIELEELDSLVQEAHRCPLNQRADPEERFPVSRQALRMFWRFRTNLGGIDEPLRWQGNGNHD